MALRECISSGNASTFAFHEKAGRWLASGLCAVDTDTAQDPARTAAHILKLATLGEFVDMHEMGAVVPLVFPLHLTFYRYDMARKRLDPEVCGRHLSPLQGARDVCILHRGAHFEVLLPFPTARHSPVT